MRPFLKQALAWVNEGTVPGGVLRNIAEDCLKARLGYGALAQHTLHALAAIEATAGIWPKTAVFLRAIADGADPAVPDDLPDTIQSDLARVSLCSRPAGVQPPRTLEIISVGFGDPATGTDLFSLVKTFAMLKGHTTTVPKAAELALRQFEAAAPERAIVVQHLRSLVTHEPPTAAPDGLPVAIGLVLVQIEAVGESPVHG